MITKGTRVRGAYMGAAFTDTVHSCRARSINGAVMISYVDLDAPVEIKSVGRTESVGFLVHTTFDGSRLPSSAGDWGDDWLEALP